MSIVSTETELPEELSRNMRQAVEWFARTGLAAEDGDAHSGLAGEVRRLNDELAFANRRLRRGLSEMERMQAILLSTLQSLTIGVLAVGQDGVVIVANPAACRLLRRPLEQLAGRTIDAALPSSPIFQDLLLTLQGAGPAQRHCSWRASEAPLCQLDFLAVRALPPYDVHLAGLVLLEDVTELRRLEQQAQLRSRLTGMGEIAMNLAHEIRNPLGSIALFASTLANELKDNEDLCPIAAQIVAGVNTLEHLVANTLEFARPRRMAMTRVSLSQALAETLMFVQHPLRQKAVTVDYDQRLAPEAWINGDSEQLRQVFLNVVINAIQSMPEGGRLRLSIQGQPAGGWEVAVHDNGSGIPSELLDKIFDPFFTTREKGSGIGLAIVHNILCAHGAQIDVQSRPGEGTDVCMRFPEHFNEDGQA